MKNILTIAMMGFCCLLNGQAKHDYNWLSGYCFGCDEPLDSFSTTVMDFNNGEVTVSQDDEITMNFDFTVSSISDENGDLLFYTNGCRIMNAEHELMENGDFINFNGQEWSLQCDPALTAIDAYKINKSVMILPQPDSPGLYFIFHLPMQVLSSGVSILSLQYTVVDMTGDGGLGKVLEKNILMLQDTLGPSFLSAAKHANGEDWWVVISKRKSNLYYKALFTSEGIEFVEAQEIGDTVVRAGGSGQAVFSPDGKKYAHYSDRNQLFYFDFDNATGELSNFQRLLVQDTLSINFGGATFSPSSKYLYVSSATKLHQFDTGAADVQASRTLIAEYDGETVHGWQTFYFTMQLGPDCRIYMIAATAAVPSMHVIHSPDEAGLACNFEQNGLRLPTFNSFSQPNFPNYRLGTGLPVCDSTIQLVTGTVRVRPPVQQAKVFPNPASGHLTVELPVPLASPGRWRLYGAVGAEVLEVALPPGQVRHGVGLGALPAGLYFWEIEMAGGNAGSGKVAIR